jgi:hypothetical protein
LRRQFETWAANDALFQPLAENNGLLAEVAPLSKDLASLGEAGIRLLDYLAPLPIAPAAGPRNKLSSKARKAEIEAQQKAQAAREEWLTRENAELARLAQPPRRGSGGSGQSPPPDVRLAAYRPVQVLAGALNHP